MFNMNQSRSNFFISLLLLLARGRNAQSPCQDYFEYKTDGNGLYGLVRVYSRGEQVSSIFTRINFTIAARLPTTYPGRLQPFGGSEVELVQQFNNGFPLNYRVTFPVTSPVPRITSISVNNDVVCFGIGDSPQQGNLYVTSITLQHTLFVKRRPGNDFSSPARPGSSFVGGQNYPNLLFDNNNNPPWSSNTDPVFVINDSRVQADDTGRPQKPVDFDTFFYPTQAPREPAYEQPPQQNTRPRPQPTPSQPVITTTTTSRPQQPPLRVDNSECGLNGNIDNLPLIYNGMSYNRGEWPWVVAIFKRKDISLNYICSGTLISDRHVISAAHCMQRQTSLTSIKDIVVKAGVYNILDWGDDDVTVTRVVSSAVIHESYNSSTLANDILMLTFTRTVEFSSYIKAACLWSGNTDLNLIVGAAGVVTGWGVNEITASSGGEPRMVRMPIVSTATCRASKPEFHKLTSSNTLCAGDRNGAGPCLGDSGGGLYLRDNGRWKLRGIVSLSLLSQNGDTTCNLNEYIVFTDAAKYLTWIANNMKS